MRDAALVGLAHTVCFMGFSVTVTEGSLWLLCWRPNIPSQQQSDDREGLPVGNRQQATKLCSAGIMNGELNALEGHRCCQWRPLAYVQGPLRTQQGLANPRPVCAVLLSVLVFCRLDLPPLPGTVALTEAAPTTATPTAPVADAEAAADGAKGAAAGGEGAVGEGGAPAQPEGGSEHQAAPAPAAAVVVAAVDDKGVVGGSAAGSWVASLGSLLVREDLDALAAVVGRPVSSAAA